MRVTFKSLVAAARVAVAAASPLSLELPGQGEGARRRIAGRSGPYGTVVTSAASGQIVEFDPQAVLDWLKKVLPTAFEEQT